MNGEEDSKNFLYEEEYAKRLADKIKKETGIGNHLRMWYDAFASEACRSEGILDCDHIKYYMQEFLASRDGITKNKERYSSSINDSLQSVLEVFEERKLIKYEMTNEGEKYIKLIGYNYLNDPEFYIAYRKKGETDWHGRISRRLCLAKIVDYKKRGYEFRESNIANSFSN